MPGRAIATYQGVVYPWQCDQVGHMNVASYTAKFDEATWNFFTHIGMDGAYFRERLGGMGAVEQHITYSRELLPGDCIRVSTEVAEVRERVITYRHEMTEITTGEVAAVCTITAVHIDTATRRASSLPDEVFSRASTMLRDADPGTGE